MIIGVDARVFQEHFPTGVTRYTHFFIESLGQKYPEAKFILFIAGLRTFCPPKFSPTLAPRITWQKLRLPHLLLNVLFLFCRWPKLDRRIMKYESQPLALLVLPNLHFVAVSRRAKVLMVVHDLSFLHNPTWFSLKSRCWHKLVMCQKLWQRADLLSCVSEITAYDLQKTAGISSKKISVMPYVI